MRKKYIKLALDIILTIVLLITILLKREFGFATIFILVILIANAFWDMIQIKKTD